MEGDFRGETLQALIRSLEAYGRRPALVAFDRHGCTVRSFGDLVRDVRRLAAGLSAAGLAQGEHALLFGPGTAEWILACLALIEAGAVPVPVDTQVGGDELTHIVRDSGARWMFAGPVQAGRVADASDRPRLVLLNAPRDDEGGLRRHLAPHQVEFAPADPEDPAVLFYTSGTTGVPKGVPLTHRNLLSNLRALLDQRLLSDRDRVLLPLPLHHVYPFTVGLLTPLASGVPVVLPHSLLGPQILRALKEADVTVIVAVPRFYSALMSAVESRVQGQGRAAWALFRAALSGSMWVRRRFGLRLGAWLFSPLRNRFAPRLRMVASGGAALDSETAWKLEGLGWEVGSGYGLTETSPILTFNRPGSRRFDSAGVPLSGVDLRIADPDPRSGLGEVLAKGPHVFAGYRNLPDTTREGFTEDGYFRTGDLGTLKDGALFLGGRASSMIVLPGGENINPEQVEAVLEKAEAIREAAVLEDRGRLVAVLVPEGAAARVGDPRQAEELIRREVQVRSASLPSHHRLADYAISPEPLPRTRLGKIRRHKLPELYAAAKRQGGVERRRGPMPVEQMAPEDRQMLELTEARRVWEWLPRRFPDAPLAPDTHLHLDLGVDSLEWLSLTLELREQTGVDLQDEAVGRIETVRDLLREAAEAGAAAGAAEDVEQRLRRPTELLDEEQRRWIAPQGPALRACGAALWGLARVLMTRVFRLRVRGLEHLPPHGPFVLVPNHTSYLDPLALAAALPPAVLRQTYWGGWTGIMFSNPLMRLVSRATRIVPVEQGRGAMASLAFGAAILDEGRPLVWFAEGGRSPDGALKPFQPGTGLLLHVRPVPVCPVKIEGGHEALPPGARWPRVRSMTVAFGRRVDPKDLERRGKGARPHERITEALHDTVASLAA